MWTNFSFSVYGGVRKSSADPAPLNQLSLLPQEEHGKASLAQAIPPEIQTPLLNISACAPSGSGLAQAALGGKGCTQHHARNKAPVVRG